jgi:hypothetical protein
MATCGVVHHCRSNLQRRRVTTSAIDGWEQDVPVSVCKISLSRNLVLYRQVRRRRALEWSGEFPAGALAIGGFGRSRWRLRRTRRSLSFSMGFQWPFRQTASLVADKKIVAPRARDSVRRASDFLQIALSLADQRSKRVI